MKPGEDAKSSAAGAGGPGEPLELMEAKREWRRGNVLRALELFQKFDWMPEAQAYLGIIKGGLGYLEKELPDGAGDGPAGALSHFDDALAHVTRGPLWEAWILAQKSEALRFFIGNRCGDLTEERFRQRFQLLEEGYEAALAKLAHEPPEKSLRQRGWIHAHRGAAYVLACFNAQRGQARNGGAPSEEARTWFQKALADFTAAEAELHLYPWASVFHAVLQAMRPRFESSGVSQDEAGRDAIKRLTGSLESSPDLRQRLSWVLELFRSDPPRARAKLEEVRAQMQRAQGSLESASEALARGDADAAARSIHAVLEGPLSGGNRFVLRCLAGLAHGAGMMDDAIRLGTLALREDPFDSMSRYFIASALLAKRDPLAVPVARTMYYELLNQQHVLARYIEKLGQKTGGATGGVDPEKARAEGLDLLAELRPADGGRADAGHRTYEHFEATLFDHLFDDERKLS